MGEVPDWYPLIVAAEVYHCSPWELEDQPVYWRDRALILRSARVQAEKQLQER